jgi:cytochrome o ubiquinol oxidase subunit 3
MEHAVSHQGMNHGHDAHHGHDHGHHDQEGLKILGFWIFLVTDCLLFSSLFAEYAILHTHTDGGPSGKELFDIPGFVTETFLLLTSSFTSGLAVMQMRRGNLKSLISWLIVTALLGLGFIGFEVKEFASLVSEGHTMASNAFLSSFFTLVGTHGCHVSLGLAWMTGIMLQLARRGINAVTSRKVFIVCLYWHFLDVVWVFLFTVVYLMGVM